jgi:hypothetical protein
MNTKFRTHQKDNLLLTLKRRKVVFPNHEGWHIESVWGHLWLSQAQTIVHQQMTLNRKFLEPSKLRQEPAWFLRETWKMSKTHFWTWVSYSEHHRPPLGFLCSIFVLFTVLKYTMNTTFWLAPLNQQPTPVAKAYFQYACLETILVGRHRKTLRTQLKKFKLRLWDGL